VYRQLKVGILAYQGGIDEHRYMVVEACKELSISCEVVNVAKRFDVSSIDALIIPGGESTTILRLMKRFGVDEVIKEKIGHDLPVMGTCAGAILLAKRVRDLKTGRVLKGTLEALDVLVVRNFYGRQRESFEIDLDIPALGEKPFRAIFIRAPAIVEVGQGVEVMARYGESYVLVRQGKVLASTFHPELSGDKRLHKYFIEFVKR
jgi:5'-phosphate synthase pdxT subunit